MEKIEKVINAVKDGYLRVVNGIASHPHIAFWAIVGLAFAAVL